MDIRKIKKEELEPLSYNDIAYHIIKLDKEAKTTVMLFKEICTLLEMSDAEYEMLIADFFTSLTTDKRFILLNSSHWDLKENHAINIVVDESEEDFDPLCEGIEIADDLMETTDETDDEFDELNDDSGLDDDDDDEFEDLQIVDEDSELEE